TIKVRRVNAEAQAKLIGLSLMAQLLNVLISEKSLNPSSFHQHTPNFLFTDDNAPPHGARIVTAGLQEVGLPNMVWPTMTSDLNLIEPLLQLQPAEAETG
uniref:Tc1-like transposase DDE domain-containing protein n=1 Tax=Oryzias latipes TaxID=8090 RepID=A0A3P9JLF5_ORYLA